MNTRQNAIENSKLFKAFYRIQNDIRIIIPIDKTLSEYYLKPIIILEEFELNLKKRFDDFTDEMSIEEILKLKFGSKITYKLLELL